MKISSAITGVGGYVPEYILDNDELSRMVDTSDEWIMTRIGIKTRHILKGEGVGTSYLGEKAVKDLLEKTSTAPDEIDLILCATVTPDMFFPSTANIIANINGLVNAICFDLSAACSGFMYGLHIADQFIKAGTYKKIILVGADKMSAIVDYTDRTTCPIFGDGAGAVLIEPNHEGLGICDTIIKTDGVGINHLYQKAGGSAYPPSYDTIDKGWHYIHQDGQVVFKAAVMNMADTAAEIMERNKLTADDIRFLVPHQANLRIIDATANRMGIDKDKCMINIDRYGNTTAATLPLCLWDYESRLKKGDNIIFAAFGGGFSWGSIYMKWAYDGATMSKE